MVKNGMTLGCLGQLKHTKLDMLLLLLCVHVLEMHADMQCVIRIDSTWLSDGLRAIRSIPFLQDLRAADLFSICVQWCPYWRANLGGLAKFKDYSSWR